MGKIIPWNVKVSVLLIRSKFETGSVFGVTTPKRLVMPWSKDYAASVHLVEHGDNLAFGVLWIT
jgi:hypothetical protein